jgi:hypothetical protein
VTAALVSGLAAGTVLAGRYEIVDVQGRGGHGAVYRAKQRPLGREVAVKVMLPEVAAGPGMSERFAREVSLVQRLEHPNTVRLFDFGTTDDGTAFMVFELLRGRSLENEVLSGPMSPMRVAKIAIQILTPGSRSTTKRTQPRSGCSRRRPRPCPYPNAPGAPSSATSSSARRKRTRAPATRRPPR